MKSEEQQRSWTPDTGAERAAVLREMAKAIESPHFRNSRRYPAFLRFIVERTLAGQAEHLKERILGIEVFGRPADYDTNSDTVVRSTAGEVRKRLHAYYSEQGREASFQISLPVGTYIPEFARNENPSGSEGSSPDSARQKLDEHSALDYQATATVDSEPIATSYDFEERAVPRRRTAWVIYLLLGIGWFFVSVYGYKAASSHFARASVLDEFWSPLLAEHGKPVICSGAVIVEQTNSYSGTQSAGKDVDYPFVSLQEANSLMRLGNELNSRHVEYDLRSASGSTLSDLQDHPLILSGAYNNQWTTRLTNPLRFHFADLPTHAIADSTNPAVLYTRDLSKPYSVADDYALVTRFRDHLTNSMVITVAGIGRNGTEAASRFVTDPHSLEQLRARLGPKWQDQNVEVVLRVPVVEGRTGEPSIETAYAW